MPASYPAALPVRTTAGSTLAANPHSTLHNAMWDEIVAITTELGTNPSGSSSTIKDKLVSLEWPATSSSGFAVNQSTSNISKTVNFSKYYKIGRTIRWHFKYTMSASGSAGTAITLTAPETAANVNGMSGVCVYRTGSVTYHCAMVGSSTTAFKLINNASGSSAVGATPSVALASGHTLQGMVVYETAS